MVTNDHLVCIGHDGSKFEFLWAVTIKHYTAHGIGLDTDLHFKMRIRCHIKRLSCDGPVAVAVHRSHKRPVNHIPVTDPRHEWIIGCIREVFKIFKGNNGRQLLDLEVVKASCRVVGSEPNVAAIIKGFIKVMA